MHSYFRAAKCSLRTLLLLGATALALAGCGGSGARLETSVPGGQLQPHLNWPPQGQPTRMASDDQIILYGMDFESRGGTTQPQGSSLLLKNGANLAYAIYAVGGFGPNVSLADLTVDFNIVSGVAGDGTGMWLGLANYSTQRWDWQLGSTPSDSFDFSSNLADYLSPDGTLYFAFVHVGPGNTSVEKLTYSRTGSGAFIPAPQNLVATPVFGSIGLSWDSVPNVQGYDVYRDTSAAFSSPTKINAGLVTDPTYSDTSVAALTDYWYAIKAFRGTPGNYQYGAFSEVAAATSLSNTVPAPTNLAGTGDLGSVSLTWDPIAGVDSYLLYRSNSADFANPTLIQAIITDPNYTDGGLAYDKMYYYEVKAKAGAQESLPSNMADVFVPASDLPAPTNLHIITQRGDFVNVGWDFVDSGQVGFWVYYGWSPDFAPEFPYFKKVQILNPNSRTNAQFDLPPNTTMYVRVCAFDNTGRGRFTDDLAFTTENYWTWETAKLIGSGTGPLAVVGGDGNTVKDSLAFFSNNAVRFTQIGSVDLNWSAPEQVGLESTDADGGFGQYLDMAYSGSDYIIGAYAPATDDAWVSIGNHNAFAATRIDGDNSTALGHAESGSSIRVAADANQYSVTHLFYVDPDVTQNWDVRLQQHPHSGGSWNNNEILYDVQQFSNTSMAYDSGNLYMLIMDVPSHQLFYGDQTGGWAWADIANSGGQNFGLYNDIHKYDGGDWITPAYNGATKEMFALQGSGNTWTKTLLTGGLDNLNRAQMAVLDDGDPSPSAVMMIFYSSANSRWFYGYFNGTSWDVSSLIIPGKTFGTNMDICKTVYPGGAYPTIVFDDTSGQIWSALGTPPS